LFEDIGGQEAVNAAVDLFYRKVLMDDTINHFLAALLSTVNIALARKLSTPFTLM